MKFYSLKFFILLLVNFFVFAVSFVLMQILSSMEQSLALIINSLVSGIIFWGYTFTTTRKLKNKENLSNLIFTLKETSVYFILMVIIAIISIFLLNEVMANIFLFFLPNTFFFYLIDNSILGGLLHIVWYAVIVFIARLNVVQKPK